MSDDDDSYSDDDFEDDVGSPGGSKVEESVAGMSLGAVGAEGQKVAKGQEEEEEEEEEEGNDYYGKEDEKDASAAAVLTSPKRDAACTWEPVRLDEVEIGQRIGGGGFAIVYQGQWRGKDVALKTLFDPRVDKKLMQEFMDELHVMGSLAHPGIVNVLGANITPPKLFIVMELCDRSLYQFLHLTHEPLDTVLGVRMCRDIASALAYLHARSPAIIHRDIKTMNLLLTIDLRIKLCDFGLVTTRTTTAGTPCYMAPELLAGKPFNKAVDVFAFGVVMWEIFSREVPWSGYDPQDIRRRVCSGERPSMALLDRLGPT
eukprot:g1298.t1